MTIWRIIRIASACDGCIWSASFLPDSYDSEEDAVKHTPATTTTCVNGKHFDDYTYFVAKQVGGGLAPDGGVIEYNG